LAAAAAPTATPQGAFDGTDGSVGSKDDSI
jgi:hypothetical protein